jgi:hypothetical protein
MYGDRISQQKAFMKVFDDNGLVEGRKIRYPLFRLPCRMRGAEADFFRGDYRIKKK